MDNLEATVGQSGAVVTKDYVSVTVDTGCNCAEYRQRLKYLCEDSDNTDSDGDGDGVPDCVDPCPDNSTPECREIPASQEFGQEELHGKSDQEDNQSGGEENQGEPINIFTGNNNIIKTDISFNSPFQEGFSFRRTYNSRSSQNEILGSGWTHSYHVRLFPDYDMANNIISVINGTGRNYLFRNNGSAYTGINQEPGSVIKIDSTYVWRVANGKEYTFGLSGALETISDKNGNLQVLAYNPDNLLKTVTDLASGRVLTFHYNASLKIDHITGPVTEAVLDGVWVTYGYDANDNLISVVYPDGSGDDFDYTDLNDIHNITAQFNKAGHLLNRWAYDADDRAYENINRNGLGITIDYSDMNAVKATDAYGVTRTFTIVENSGKKIITNIACDTGKSIGGPGVARYLYDDSRRIIEKEYENGRIDKFEDLDDRGNPQRIIEAFGAANQTTLYFTWHPDLHQKLSRSQASLIGPGNKETIWDYDTDYDDIPNEAPSKNISRIIEKGFSHDIDGSVVSYAHITEFRYNPKGQIISMDGPLAGDQDKVSFAYDPLTSDLISMTNPLGIVSYTRDAAGNIISNNDMNSVETHNVYDAKNRLLSTTRDGKTSSLTYTLAGEIETVTDASQRRQAFNYDAQYGRLEKNMDASGNYHLYGYDPMGNVIDDSAYTSEGARTHWVRFDYQGADLPGRLWKQINFDGSFTEFGYDNSGNRNATTTPDNKEAQYSFDEYHRITAITKPGTVITAFAYDGHGNLSSVTDANNNTTSYTHDDLGRLIQAISPDTGTVRYSYDNAGNLQSKILNSGTVITYSHDSYGRTTGIHYADTSQDMAFTYDEGENGKGRPTGKTGPGYSYVFKYNTLGLISSETKTIDAVSHTTRYAYDNTGRLTEMTYPSGRTVTYELNADGQYLSASTSDSETTDLLAANANYQSFGPNTGFDFANGIKLTKSYDLGYNLVGITAGKPPIIENNPVTPHVDLSYTRRFSGNIETISDHLNPAGNQNFTYDDLYRLTNASTNHGELTYTYDTVGNRRTKNTATVDETYNYIPERVC
ncbi:MAG: RHS repeat protein [Desulfobacterium sp.]|nr:RHS repeat protein [Desulfobacterium sp.]